MIKKLYIVFIILTSIVSTVKVDAQYTDMVCTGMTRVYRVTGEKGATLTWKVNGGVIRQNWTDSVEVEWNTAGVFTIEVNQVNIYGCKAITSAEILVGSQPEISLGNNLSICRGKNLQLDAGPGFVDYYWNNEKGNQTYLAINSGKYKVTAYTASGCSATDSVDLAIVENPVVELGNNLALCGDEKVELDAGPDGPYYNWSDNSTSGRINIAHSVSSPQYLKVKVTNINGCSTSDSILLDECDYSKFAQLIPNTFTPSDDNSKNNTWLIPWLLENFPNARIEVFDRWGQSVYLATKVPVNGWDGKRNGKYLPTDSYYYVIDLRNGSKPITGSVTIVR